MVSYQLINNNCENNKCNKCNNFVNLLGLIEIIDSIIDIYDDYIKGFMNTKFDITQLKFREKWNKKYIDQEKYNKNK